jgi:hypothetical protein
VLDAAKALQFLLARAEDKRLATQVAHKLAIGDLQRGHGGTSSPVPKASPRAETPGQRRYFSL